MLVATGVQGFIARAVATVLIASISSKLFGPKAPRGVGFRGRQVTTRGSLDFRKIVYGQALVSGPIVYNNTAGSSNEDLWYVIPMATHQCDSLVSVWFDDVEIAVADIDWTPGGIISPGVADGTGTGNVTDSAWVGTGSPQSIAVKLFWTLGYDDQPVLGPVDTAFTDWGTNNRIRGSSILAAALTYNEATQEVWKDGAPRDIKGLWKGRPVYDSRLDSTNGGSGSHRYTDSLTWEWSDNPWLCIADYLVNYMGADATVSINWSSFATAADDADTLVVIPPAASPSNYEKRFTCNGVLSTGETHRDNLNILLSSCAGSLSYSGGQWIARPSTWAASTVSITDDDILSFEVRGAAPKSERYNTIRGWYVDPSRLHKPVEFLQVTSSTYVTRDDGEILDHDIELAMTNSEYMAQRIGYRHLEQFDNQRIVSMKLGQVGAKIAIGDTVDVTIAELSWTAETYRCIEWKMEEDGNFAVALKEDSAASYTDPLESAYTERLAGGGVSLPTYVVAPPSGLTATAVDFGVQLDWTNPAPDGFHWIQVYESDSSAWGGATKIATTRADTLFIPYTTAVQKWYWVRALGSSTTSIRDPDSDTSTVTATPTIPTPGDDGLSVFVANVYKRSASAPSTPSVDDGSYNFTTTTLTPPTGWSTTPPAQTSPSTGLYVSTGSFSISGPTGTDNTVTWTSPDLLVTDGAIGPAGADGDDGTSVYVASVFKRNASAPSTPSVDDGQYNFTTNTLTPPSGWSVTPPGPTSPITPLYVSTGSFSIIGQTGTDTTVTWTSPDLLVQDGATGPAGSDGSDGLSVFVGNVYKRSASTPSTPSVDDGQYNFTTQTLTPPTGWSVTPPAQTSPVTGLYVSTGPFSITGPTGTDTTVTWTSPDLLVQDGADGAPGAPGSDGSDGDDGISVFVGNVYKRSASAPSTPSVDDGQYNFTTNTLTPPSTWSTTPPAQTSPVTGLYLSTGSFSIVGQTGTDTTVTWTSPDLLVQDGATGAAGADGSDGQSVYVANVFKRSASAPSTPSVDDGQYNFTSNTLTPPTGWSVSPPAQTSPVTALYVSSGSFSIVGQTGTDTTVTWTAPDLLVQDGTAGAPGSDGDDGISVFVANVYKRNASAPSTPSVDDGQYNFTTNTLTPPTGWSVSPPSQTSPVTPIYVSSGSFSIVGQTGTDTTVTWTAPDLLVQDGATGPAGSDGSDGLSVYVGNVFKRSASAPSTPSVDDGQYNFTTQTLTPPTGWSTSPPAQTSPVTALYISTGSFSIIGQTGTDTTVTWTSPDLLVQDGAAGPAGSDGADGDDGLSVHVANVYKRSASAPSTPSADDGQYNFTTNTLTPPTGWSVTPPAQTSPVTGLYVSTGPFSIVGQTGTDTTVTWTAPDLLVQDGAAGPAGADGSDGLSVFVGTVFKRSASAPSTPSVDDGQYNFTTQTLTAPTGWSTTPPAQTSPNTGLYVSSGSFSIIGQTGTDTTVTWTSPDLLVQDGATGPVGGDGDDGVSVFVANIFKRSASAPSTPSVDDGSYNFTTSTLTPPSGWSVTPPAGSDPLYVSTGPFSIVGQTGTDTTVTWTTPDLLVQETDIGIPDYAVQLTYDDLDIATASPSPQLAAGISRYAMLTDRDDNASGSQNNFQNTDAILINKSDFTGAIHDGFFGSLRLGERIGYVISADRWYIFKIDEIMGTVGTGSALAYKVGVTYVFSKDADPTVTISTAAGTAVDFEFQRTEFSDLGSSIADPDFDLTVGTSSPIAGALTSGEYWLVTLDGNGVVDFAPGGGDGGSNAIDIYTTSDSGSDKAYLESRPMIKSSQGTWEYIVKYMTTTSTGAGTMPLKLVAAGYATPLDTTVVQQGTYTVLLPESYNTWSTVRVVVPTVAEDAARYWGFRFGLIQGFPDMETYRFDSVFVNPVPGTFGDDVVNTKVTPGIVPEADTTTDANKVLQADGTWVANAGGGTPTDITVADESSDTTCFPAFFTAATGDLAPKTDASGLTYNASTGDWSATLIAGIANANLLDKSANETITADTWTWNRQANGVTTLTIGENTTLRGDSQDSRILMYSEQSSSIKLASINNSGSNLQFDITSGLNVQFLGDGSWTYDIRDGATVYIRDAGDTDYVAMSHDGTDFWATGVNTRFFYFNDLTDSVSILDGAGLRIYDSGNTDFVKMSHDGTDFNFAFTNTATVNFNEPIENTTISSGVSNAFQAVSGLPGIWLSNTDAAADEGGWKLLDDDSGNLIWYATTDAGSSINALWGGIRGTGTAISSLRVYEDLEVWSGKDLRIYNSAATGYATFNHNGTDFIIRNEYNAGWLRIQADDTGGTAQEAMSFDPDGDLVFTSQNNLNLRLDTGAGNELALSAQPNSSVFLYYDNNVKFNTTTSGVRVLRSIFLNEIAAAAADVTGDGQIWVKTATPNNLYFTTDSGLDYPVGYARYRVLTDTTLDNQNVTETIGAQHVNGVWHKTTSTARTLTLETSSGFNFPVGSQLSIYNRATSGNMTVTDTATQTLWYLDGTTAVDSVGGVVIGPGGYATLIRESATVSVIMGAGIT
jgi:hypothetical protein